ncbi:MAG: hypothetical protein QGH90_03595 [Candidatus Poseidoniaceae archaeon]|jgi:hypothetical protein|nr:hypothetical protein [Candidatus Poseidoniaceae archaeon]
MQGDDNGQVHILEMVTLFWLFFMTALFLIQIHIPDSPSIASDSTLELAAEDAIQMGVSAPAIDESIDNRLVELLLADDREGACELLLNGLTATVDGECWLAKNAGISAPHGDGVEPSGSSITVHRLVQVEADAWTVSIDVWYRGGIH